MPVKHTRALDSDALRAKLLTRCRERGISPRRMQQEAGLISGARIIAQLESGQSMMSDGYCCGWASSTSSRTSCLRAGSPPTRATACPKRRRGVTDT